MSIAPTSPSHRQNASNLRMYATPDVARAYAVTPDRLKPAEEAILGNLAGELRGKVLLDLGVGGGRTTPHLLELSADYLGVDYSGEMVEACRSKYPGVAFRECDARDMTALGRDCFDFIFFSFNGIDSIDHTGRLQALREIFALLRAGGVFMFSAHNLQVPVERPWHPSIYTWAPRPRLLLYNVKSFARNLRNFLRHRPSQVYGHGYATLVDSQLDFQMTNYYIDPAEQVRQLEARGFRDIEMFDREGKPGTPEALGIKTTGHVHYVARKPPAI